MKQQLSLLTPEQKQKAINDIISYFLDERGEEIGVIAADDILDSLSDSLC